MIWTLVLKNWKWIGIAVILLGGATYVFALKKQRDHYKSESIRLSDNAESVRQSKKNDSVTFSEVILTQKEFIDDMNRNHKEQLENIEKKLDINAKQIRRIQTTKTVYISKDTTSYVLNEILKGIQEQRSVSEKVLDSTKCHIVEGIIHFNGKDLKLDITKVGYTNVTDIVAFLQKKKWGWLPWNWFKRRKITVSVLNSCGVTETRLVEIQK